MGFHPSKARLPGQLLTVTLSASKGALQIALAFVGRTADQGVIVNGGRDLVMLLHDDGGLADAHGSDPIMIGFTGMVARKKAFIAASAEARSVTSSRNFCSTADNNPTHSLNAKRAQDKAGCPVPIWGSLVLSARLGNFGLRQ